MSASLRQHHEINASLVARLAKMLTEGGALQIHPSD